MNRFGIGQSVRRLEDPRLLTGQGRFTDDLPVDGAAHGHVLRSPHAHARIRRIDTATAKAAPGVLGVFVAADIAALGSIPCLSRVAQIDGTPMRLPRFPILADDKAAYAGQPVAFVVAETLDQAKDAAERIEVDYEPLPAIADTGRATDPDAPQIWDEAPRNTSFRWGSGDEAATEAALAAAPHRLALRLVNNRLVAASVETRIAIGEWDGRRYTLTTTSQGPHSLRDQLARDIFMVAEDAVRVVTHEVGGGFGMKIFMYSELPLVLFAARALGRPVRWVGERSADSFSGDYHGRDQVNAVEVGYDGSGRILGLRVRTNAALGAFVSNAVPYIVTECGAPMLSGVYAIPAIALQVDGVFTNTVPVDAYRGAGHPEAIYVVERAIEAVARALGRDLAEVKRRNVIRPEQLPFTTAMDWTYDSGGFEALMDRALSHADATGFAARRADAKARGKLRGLGIAHYLKGVRAGMGESARIAVDTDGTATVFIGNQSNGQGHETVFAQVIADRLGINLAQVRLVQGDTDRVRTGHGTGGSRSMLNCVPACDGAAVKVIENGTLVAAEALEAAAADIEFADGTFRIAGTDRQMSLAAVAVAARAQGGELSGDAEFTAPGMTFPNGCHACEVEVDPETGAVRIVGYWAVDDFGRLVNPLLLEGQVHGGLAQGIGQALTESVIYDDAGQLVSGSFMDYGVPRADDLPDLSVDLVEDYPCRTNPMGIKGAGEAGAVAAPPVVINAILDALAPLGVRHIDMPATPERVWRAIREAR